MSDTQKLNKAACSGLPGTTCYACGSHAEAVFSRIVPMGYHCPDCGVSDRATVACYWRGKTCYCDEKLMPTCDYHEAAEGLRGMCVHNLDKSQPKGSPAEITDFCFHAQARSYSQHNVKEHAPPQMSSDGAAIEPLKAVAVSRLVLPSSYSVYDTRHPMHQPYMKPLFGSKKSSVNAVTEDTKSQREVATQNCASLPDSQHVTMPSNEPHGLEVSEKSRKDHMNRKQWYKVVLDVVGQFLGKEQQQSQQRQGKDSGEVTGIERDRELVEHGGVSEIILENVKEHAPLSAGASVDHGVDVETTAEHENRAADRGCCVSSCSISSFILESWRLKDPQARVMKWLLVFTISYSVLGIIAAILIVLLR